MRPDHLRQHQFVRLPQQYGYHGGIEPERQAGVKLFDGVEGQLDGMAIHSDGQLQVCAAASSGAGCQCHFAGVELLFELFEQPAFEVRECWADSGTYILGNVLVPLNLRGLCIKVQIVWRWGVCHRYWVFIENHDFRARLRPFVTTLVGLIHLVKHLEECKQITDRKSVLPQLFHN